MNLGQQDEASVTRQLATLASPEFLNNESPITTYVVGRHHHHCRWYPEDASLVADNIEV
jgi:hypothetical protein